MIVNEEFLKKLRSVFNLNIYEVKIWTSLLSRGLATAGELSDNSNVPRSRCYDVLESLEKKGFVIMKIGKPIKYIAVDPKEVIKRVKQRIEKSAEEQVDMLNRVKDTNIYEEINLLYKQNIAHIDPIKLSGTMKGRDSIYNQIDSMLNDAKRTVTIMTTTEGLKRKVRALKPKLQKLAKRGVKIKIAAPVTEDVLEDIKQLKDIAQVKNIEKIQGRFVIVDEEEVLFMVTNDKEVPGNYDLGIWVKTPYFAKSLNNMFNVTWERV